MIPLKLNSKILKAHKELIFGRNALLKGRLVQKLLVERDLARNNNNVKSYHVLNFIIKNLNDIILGNLDELDKLKNIYTHLIHRISDEKERNEFLDKLKQIFYDEYKYFYSSRLWNAYEFQKTLDINICPYCGTQFIFLYESDNGKTRGTLDHFFDKGTYPIFAISIYNLVPSCKVCNSDFKGKKAVDLVNYYSPYEDNIVENITFKRTLIEKKDEQISSVEKYVLHFDSEIDYVAAILGKNNDFNITLDFSGASNEIAQKIKGNLELFKIEELYNSFHKSYVQNLINRANIYNFVYKQQLIKAFPLIFDSIEELKVYSIPNEKDDKTQILNKLTRDIMESEILKEIL